MHRCSKLCNGLVGVNHIGVDLRDVYQFDNLIGFTCDPRGCEGILVECWALRGGRDAL